MIRVTIILLQVYYTRETGTPLYVHERDGITEQATTNIDIQYIIVFKSVYLA